MKPLFSEKSTISDFITLRDNVKRYVKENLCEQHMRTTQSLESYQCYKPETQSLKDISYYKLNSYDYKYSHCLSVAQNCIKLSEIEGNAHGQLLELAGLLHDVAHFKGNYKCHGVLSAKMSVEFLLENSSLSEDEINGISRMINAHYPEKLDKCYYYSGDISLEEILLLEADFLDKLSLRKGMLIFLECGNSKLPIKEAIDQYERKIIKKAHHFLTQPVKKRECHYTDSFLLLLKEQLEINEKYLKNLKDYSVV